MHETEEGLRSLRENYKSVIQYLKNTTRDSFFAVDASKPQHIIIKTMTNIIKKELEHKKT